MFEVAATAFIQCPPSTVYAWLISPEAWPKWVADVKQVDAPGKLLPGVEFSEITLLSGAEKCSRGRVVESVPDRRLVLQIDEVLSGPRLRPRRVLDLTPESGGTRLTWTNTVEAEGWIQLLQPLLRGMFRGKMVGYLAELKGQLEGG